MTRDEAIAEVYKHCDLQQRLASLPPSAKVRGVFFRSIDRVLGQAGLLPRFELLFPNRPSSVPWYPFSEFLTQVAVGGAMLAGAEQVQHGMYEIGRRNAIAVAESLFGRALLRLLSPNPRNLLMQGMAARRQGFNVGTWELTFPSDRSAVMTMKEEYLYMDSYLLGAAYGTFETINVPVKVECVLDDPYNGRHFLSW
ncbi:MAG TPA: DUF2378 family protein [Polyangiales bacterium]|nr:DUF2378 family protein [Polyangiales bacterium]